MVQDVVIVSAARTPIGVFQGSLSQLTAPQLGAVAIKASIERAGISKEAVEEVILGEVLQAGVGQAPARQAALSAGLPNSVACTTVNKVCGSGLKAIMLARQSILLGDASIVIAGGMESMSNAPYLLPSARTGFRMGNQQAVDAMIHDGLWDPYGNAHMGCFGDQCARHFDFTREAQDAYAKASYEKALRAQKEGFFDNEIASVTIEDKKQTITVNKDEEPNRYQPDKMSQLRAAFGKEGTVTAANASKINDGAAAVTLMSSEEAQKRGAKILGHIVSTATFAQAPEWFTTAPIGAIKKALEKAQLSVSDIDLYEINEAFSVVAMAAIKELSIDPAKVNVFGGAVALGHPIGCSGARLVVTLLSAMEQRKVRYGCVSLCLGGGEAVAMIIRRGEK